MFFAAGARAAVRPDARLVHERERALERRPVALELLPKLALDRRVQMIFLLHKREYSRLCMHIIVYAY